MFFIMFRLIMWIRRIWCFSKYTSILYHQTSTVYWHTFNFRCNKAFVVRFSCVAKENLSRYYGFFGEQFQSHWIRILHEYDGKNTSQEVTSNERIRNNERAYVYSSWNHSVRDFQKNSAFVSNKSSGNHVYIQLNSQKSSLPLQPLTIGSCYSSIEKYYSFVCWQHQK